MRQQWRALAELTEAGEPGWTRRAFSDAYADERGWIRDQFRAAGCAHVEVDAGGNVVGIFPGQNPNLPPLVLGSHTDTVQGGGRFDGIVGVLGALEVIRRIRSSAGALNRDVYVYDFLGEEVGDFGVGCIGSKAATGSLSATELSQTNGAGLTLGDQLQRHGLRPGGSPVGRSPRDWHAYVELHIEQATTLEAAQVDIGVVTAIAGIRRMVARFVGEQNHAGGARMRERRDALLAAARATLTVNDFVCGADEFAVATTTEIVNRTSSLNVVSGEARLRAEMRSTDTGWLDRTEQSLVERIASESASMGVEADLSWSTDNPVAHCTPSIRDHIVEASEVLGLSWAAVPSGATHDAAHIAEICPTAMIFVPSEGGKSHCPEEHTDWGDIVNGVNALVETVTRLDGEADMRRRK